MKRTEIATTVEQRSSLTYRESRKLVFLTLATDATHAQICSELSARSLAEVDEALAVLDELSNSGVI